MSSKAVSTVTKLLANATDAAVVRALVSPTATYVSLNYDNPNLTQIMPWCGTHESVGPDAILDTFVKVNQFWKAEEFKIHAAFGENEHVAVFGQFTYRSIKLGKVVTSPFCVWCRLDVEGKISYMQFMEDTLATSESFKKEGRVVYASNPEGGEFVVDR